MGGMGDRRGGRWEKGEDGRRGTIEEAGTWGHGNVRTRAYRRGEQRRGRGVENI